MIKLFYKKRVKTPTIIQMEAVECGAACLAIIMGYFGRFVPLEQLRIDCGVSRDGSNVYNMIKAAETYGITAEASKKTFDDLNGMPFPGIIFWEFNHFMVLEGIDKKKVYLNDPAFGPRTMSHQEFKDGFAGLYISLKKGDSFTEGGKLPSLPKLLYTRLKSSSTSLYSIVFTSFCLLLPGFAMPAFLMAFLDTFFNQSITPWTSQFLWAVSLMGLFAFSLTLLQKYILNRLNVKLSICFSSEFFWKLLKLPSSFYSQRYAGEISWRMSLNNQIASILTNYLVAAFIDLLLIFFYGVVLFFYDVLIACVVIVLAFMNLFIMARIYRSRSDAYARMQQSTGKVAAEAIGGLRYIETIKSKGSESDFFSKWSGHFMKKLNSIQEIGLKDTILLATPLLFQYLAVTALLGIGSYRISQGIISAPVLFAMQILILKFLDPINRAVGYTQILQNMKVDVQRLNDVMNNPIDEIYTLRKEAESKTEIKKLTGQLEFRNVCFRYAPLSPMLIENLNFTIKPGERLALVGASGSGKSTVSKLASGLYRPVSGEILYDGIPITEIPGTVFRNYIATVDQEIFLFSGTIRENICLWNQKIPEKVLINASMGAYIHEEILERPDGYDAQLIEGGGNLSFGQRQRLEIARALLYAPSLLLLDEATSALDSSTEKHISDEIRRRGISAMMIAHRLSTIQDCDQIIVLERGKVAQRGTHDELKNQEGIYKTLVLSEGDHE